MAIVVEDIEIELFLDGDHKVNDRLNVSDMMVKSVKTEMLCISLSIGNLLCFVFHCVKFCFSLREVLFFTA
ncbi:hypothetical protein DNU06_15070 [Putridiphycobacter roseus]|uniref:Uncharacterized protein n=1 Tax=Putridiphycobacter roseus TaxID=2219161 RepID=A0A2W1MVW3_9FLAO|nr:hypothetical protein DNU06_15070 [Putridiphycobacter roseus]